MRGQPEDFARWTAMGNTGWSYEDVLPYYRNRDNARRQDATMASRVGARIVAPP
jgi:choline dehydrogenase-like flavoprotein